MLGYTYLMAIAALTTLLGYIFTRRVLGVSTVIPVALRRLAECVGAFFIFLSLNVVVGLSGVFLIRLMTAQFVSVYVLDDATIVALSALQAVLFRLWWSA
jgi:hypothetical protein